MTKIREIITQIIKKDYTDFGRIGVISLYESV